MKQAYLLIAFPLAIFTASPLFDTPNTSHFHPHKNQIHIQEYIPVKTESNEEFRHTDFNQKEININNRTIVNFYGRNIELKKTTRNFTKTFLFNSIISDADINIDFQIENELINFSERTMISDVDMNERFYADQKIELQSNSIDLKNAEINSLFENEN